jgi:serine/threonine protein kinase
MGVVFHICSAGACTYYLLCAQLPHDTTSPSIAFASSLNSHPRLLLERDPDLPPDLCAAIDRALSREPSDRFSSAQQMRQALLKFTEEF